MSDIKKQIEKLEAENEKLREKVRGRRIPKITKNKAVTPESLYWIKKKYDDLFFFSTDGLFGVEVIQSKLIVYVEDSGLKDSAWDYKGKKLIEVESEKEPFVVPKPEDLSGTFVKYEDFKKAFNLISFRTNLTRILFSEEDGIVSTDSRRLINIKIPVKQTVVFPYALITFLDKFKQDFTFQVNQDGNIFIFFRDGYIFYKFTSSDNVSFPKWRNVLSREINFTETLDRDRLAEILNEFKTYSASNEYIKVIFEDGYLKLNLIEADVELKREVGWKSEPIAFNLIYLLDVIGNVYDDTITFTGESPLSPVQIETENVFMVIMPIKI